MLIGIIAAALLLVYGAIYAAIPVAERKLARHPRPHLRIAWRVEQRSHSRQR